MAEVDAFGQISAWSASPPNWSSGEQPPVVIGGGCIADRRCFAKTAAFKREAAGAGGCCGSWREPGVAALSGSVRARVGSSSVRRSGTSPASTRSCWRWLTATPNSCRGCLNSRKRRRSRSNRDCTVVLQVEAGEVIAALHHGLSAVRSLCMTYPDRVQRKRRLPPLSNRPSATGRIGRMSRSSRHAPRRRSDLEEVEPLRIVFR